MSPTLLAIALHALELHASPTRETPDARARRLRRIAADAVLAVEVSDPLPGMNREATLRLLLATAVVESAGLLPEVDRGDSRGDRGRSVCLMQINVGRGHVQSADPLIATWRAADLVADRVKCFRAGLDAARWSMSVCAGLRGGDRLSAYVSGRCVAGIASARHRWYLASKLALASVVEEGAAPAGGVCSRLDAAIDRGPLLVRPFPG